MGELAKNNKHQNIQHCLNKMDLTPPSYYDMLAFMSRRKPSASTTKARNKRCRTKRKDYYHDSKASLQAFTRSPLLSPGVDPLAMEKKKLAVHLKRMLEGDK